jgi:hypothetical protein
MPEVQEFDEYPHIQEVLEWGGVAGVTYAYIPGEQIARAVRDEFEFVHGSPAFTVRGRSFVVMADKNTTPIPGAAKDSGRCRVLVPKETADGQKEKAQAKEQGQAKA